MTRSRLIALGLADCTVLAGLATLGPFGTIAILSALATLAYCVISPAGLLIVLTTVSQVAQLSWLDEKLLRMAKWGIVTIFLCFALLRIIRESRTTAITVDGVERSFLLYIFWAAICSMFAVKPEASIGEVIRLLAFLPIYFVARYSLKSTREIGLILIALLIAVVLAGAASAGQILDIGLIRVRGLYQNANMLGVFLSFAIPGLVIGMILTGSRILKLAYSAGIAIGIGALLLSWSRAAYFSIAVQVLAYIIIEKKKRLLTALSLGVGILVIVIVLTPTLRLVASESLRLRGGATHRTTLWKHGLDAFANNPIFGLGFEVPKEFVAGKIMWNSFVDYILYSDPETRFMPHNMYIYALMSNGLLGLVVLLLLYRAMIKRQLDLRGLANDTRHRKVHTVMLAIVIGTLAYGFFETSSFFGAGSWANYFWVLLGMSEALGTISAKATANA
jgi:O-antigen ligase